MPWGRRKKRSLMTWLIKAVALGGVLLVFYWTFPFPYGPDNDMKFHEEKPSFMLEKSIIKGQDHEKDEEVFLKHQQKMLKKAEGQAIKILAGPELNNRAHGDPGPNNGLDDAAELETSLDRLDEQFRGYWEWDWIKDHIHNNWEHVTEAAERLHHEMPGFKTRSKRHVLFIPGFLTVTDFARPQRAYHGGPLGELRQWADLIAATHVLGHQVTLQSNLAAARAGLQALAVNSRSFLYGCEAEAVDIIITDVQGWDYFPQQLQEKIRRQVRIVDVFGTEVMYNVPSYAQTHDAVVGAGQKHLCPRQFLTMYPEVPDNTFLGFTVSDKSNTNTTKSNIGIIYGKSLSYLQGREELLHVLQKHMEVHCTVDGSTWRFPGLINHGVVPGGQYQDIISKAKFVIGLGNPIEGPGAIEAIAHGAIFIQPKFHPPVRLRGKPNNRTFSSQIPYFEHRVGTPHVLTLNYSDYSLVEEAIIRAKRQEVRGMLPAEFSMLGYLKHMHNHIQHVDFCGTNSSQSCSVSWPPSTDLVTVLAGLEAYSCTDTCLKKGLDCEYNFFPSLNSVAVFEKQGLPCSRKQTVGDVYAPAYIRSSQTCILQQNPELFSCSSYIQGDYLRLCPCRVYGSW